MGKHKALKGAIAAVASVATLGALQPSATATPRRSQARRWQVCGRIHRIQRRCSAFLRAQGQVRQRGLRFRQLHSGLRRACQDRCDCALQSFVLAHVSPFFSLRCIAISTLGFVNQLPRRFRRTKRELSSSQSEYLSQTLFPSTVIPNIPSRLNHDSCFCCMMCKRSGGGAASQAETWPV